MIEITEAELETLTNMMHTLLYEMEGVWVSEDVEKLYKRLDTELRQLRAERII